MKEQRVVVLDGDFVARFVEDRLAEGWKISTTYPVTSESGGTPVSKAFFLFERETRKKKSGRAEIPR